MTLSHRRKSTLLVVTVSTAIIALTLGAVAGGQSAGVREGTCELAEELFPDHNPGPGTLKEIPVPEPTDLDDLRPEPRRRHRAGQGALLGHAGGQRRRTGLRVVPLPRRRRSAFDQPVESRRRRQPRSDDRSGRPEPSTEGVGLSAAQAGRSHRPSLDGAPRRRRRRLVAGRAPAAVRAARSRARPRTSPSPVPDPVFNIDGINTRRAEPRNTPTMINAAFNLNNFWDRRARNIFNGVSVQGAGDSGGARVARDRASTTSTPVIVRIDNASLASQAVGPPLSDREMGSLGRTFKDVGKRLASAQAAAAAEGRRDDSVLGPLRR